MITVKRIFYFFLLPLLLAGCVAEKNCCVALRSQSGHIFKITAYGAVDNPKISSADAFRHAIAGCKKAGGGIVEVPAGHFLTGPIDMVDNMTLQVDSGAVVLFDTARTNYPDIISRWEGLTEKGPHPLIFANGLTNISITGHGTFDGQGAIWWANMDMAEHGNARPNRPIRRRPMMLQIKDCNRRSHRWPGFSKFSFLGTSICFTARISRWLIAGSLPRPIHPTPML